MKLLCVFAGISLFISSFISVSHAQTLVPPLAGTMVDEQGRIAMLQGVAGNLLPPDYSAPPELQGEAILSAAFNANGGVLKTESHLALLDNQGALLSFQPAPQGTALVSFDADGTPAWVLYASDAELVNISSARSTVVRGVVALGPAGASSVPLLKNTGSQLWTGTVSVPSGIYSAQNPIPGSAPAAFFQEGWLTSSSSGLLWTPMAPGKSAREIALPQTALEIQTASSGAVVINRQWLLNAHFQLLEIPRVRRPEPRAEAHP